MQPEDNKPSQTPFGFAPEEPTPSPTPPPHPISKPPEPKKKGPSSQFIKGFLSFMGFAISVIILAALINMFVFQSYYVDGTSMTPTLQPNERLIIDKLPRTWARITRSHYIPKRGDIVVFNSTLRSPDNGQYEQLIKRVVGLPGERVVVKDGKVTIYNNQNPKGMDVDQTLNLSLAPTDGDIDEVVPSDELFVLGDNRAPGGSYDSRTELGPIPSDEMVGQLVMRLVPLNKAKFF